MRAQSSGTGRDDTFARFYAAFDLDAVVALCSNRHFAALVIVALRHEHDLRRAVAQNCRNRNCEYSIAASRFDLAAREHSGTQTTRIDNQGAPSECAFADRPASPETRCPLERAIWKSIGRNCDRRADLDARKVLLKQRGFHGNRIQIDDCHQRRIDSDQFARCGIARLHHARNRRANRDVYTQTRLTRRGWQL